MKAIKVATIPILYILKLKRTESKNLYSSTERKGDANRIPEQSKKKSQEKFI